MKGSEVLSAIFYLVLATVIHSEAGAEREPPRTSDVIVVRPSKSE